MEAPLDTLRAVETPEGVTLTLRVAGPVARALAFGIDFMARIAFYMLVGGMMGSLGEAGSGLMMLVIFVCEWFYPVFFEVLWGGRTPGKMALSLAVVHPQAIHLPRLSLLRTRHGTFATQLASARLLRASLRLLLQLAFLLRLDLLNQP